MEGGTEEISERSRGLYGFDSNVEAVGARVQTGQEVGARAVLFPLVAILSQTISRAETKKHFKGELLCIYCAGQTSGFQESEIFFRDCAIAPKHFPRLRNLSQNIAPSEAKNNYRGNLCINSCADEIVFSATARNRNREIEIAKSKSRNRNRKIEFTKNI